MDFGGVIMGKSMLFQLFTLSDPKPPPFAKLEKISAEKEYSPDFAPKNRPIGGFWRGNYGEIYFISNTYLGPPPELDLNYGPLPDTYRPTS
jgi:hypothetical protein